MSEQSSAQWDYEHMKYYIWVRNIKTDKYVNMYIRGNISSVFFCDLLLTEQRLTYLSSQYNLGSNASWHCFTCQMYFYILWISYFICSVTDSSVFVTFLVINFVERKIFRVWKIYCANNVEIFRSWITPWAVIRINWNKYTRWSSQFISLLDILTFHCVGAWQLNRTNR